MTSGSIKAAGHTYGPPNGNQTQFLEVASSGSERYLFFLSDGTSTTKPTALSLNLELDRADSEYREVRVEAKAGITDWRDVADNFFEQMKLELQTRTSLATVTSSSAGSITATASITIAYASLAGGVSVGNGKFNNLGSPTATHRLRQPSGFTPGADNASSGNHPIANNAGNDAKTTGEPSNTGIFVESTTSGSAATTANHAQLRQSDAKMYFDNGTTYYVGATSNVQFLTASAARITTLDVEEIVSRSTSKNSLEISDKLVIAGVSASALIVVGAGFQLGGKTAVQGTGSAALFSLTMGDPGVNEGMVMKVNDTRIASINSGSFYRSSGMVGDGMLAVTGAISASHMRSHIVHGGTVSGSSLTVQRAVLMSLMVTQLFWLTTSRLVLLQQAILLTVR